LLVIICWMDVKINWIVQKVLGSVELGTSSVLHWYDISFSEMDVILINITRKIHELWSLDASVSKCCYVEHITPGASREVELC